MHEKSERAKGVFRFPNITAESGEFERVGQAFGIDSSVLMYEARSGQLLDPNEEIWCDLENSDSNGIRPGDWEVVAANANQVERDWMLLRDRMSSQAPLDAPIIMQPGSRYHLVSGNTRLMVARALGITPKILLFNIDMPASS